MYCIVFHPLMGSSHPDILKDRILKIEWIVEISEKIVHGFPPRYYTSYFTLSSAHTIFRIKVVMFPHDPSASDQTLHSEFLLLLLPALFEIIQFYGGPQGICANYCHRQRRQYVHISGRPHLRNL